MKVLGIVILILLVFGPAHADDNGLTGQHLLEKIYQENQYLGFAIGNHSSIFPFVELLEFVENHGAQDPALNAIYFEGPYELVELFQMASENKILWSDLQKHLSPFYLGWFQLPQNVFLVHQILRSLQKINQSRKANPIYLLPIDSYSESWSSYDQIIAKPFGTSISREKLTAANFYGETLKRGEKKKALLIYHQAHLLKNVLAKGHFVVFNEADKGLDANYPLGWVDYVLPYQDGFHEKLGVVLFNEKDDQFNPEGILDLKTFKKSVWKNGDGLLFSKSVLQEGSEASALFLKNSFFGSYREGSIEFPKDLTSVFDGVIYFGPETYRSK